MNIAIIGATGYVGGKLVRSVSNTDSDVQLRLFGRNRSKLEVLGNLPKVESVQVYEQGESLEGLLRGVNACIDLSYQTRGVPSKQVSDSTVHTKNLIRACKIEGVKRLCIVGTVAVYGTSKIHYPWVEVPGPDRLPFPDSVYARVKGVVERVAQSEIRGTQVQLALVRSGHIVGVGSGMMTNICSSLLAGNCVLLDNHTAPSNATTVRGLNTTLLRLATCGWEPPVIIANHVDLSNISYDTICKFLAKKVNLEPVSCKNNVKQKRSIKSMVVQGILEHQERLSVLQSYLGYSESLVGIAKNKVKGKAGRTESSHIGGSSAQRIIPLYESDRVPHTAEICGAPVLPDQFESSMKSIGHWIESAGYLARDVERLDTLRQ